MTTTATFNGPFNPNATHRTDALGVPILVGDTVRVIYWGTPVRLGDVSRTGRVTGTTRSGNICLDNPDIAAGRAVSPGMVAVQRRDGRPGHQANA